MFVRRTIVGLMIVVFTVSLIVILGHALFPKEDPEPFPVSVTLAHDKGNLPFFHAVFIKMGHRAEETIGVGIKPLLRAA